VQFIPGSELQLAIIKLGTSMVSSCPYSWRTLTSLPPVTAFNGPSDSTIKVGLRLIGVRNTAVLQVGQMRRSGPGCTRSGLLHQHIRADQLVENLFGVLALLEYFFEHLDQHVFPVTRSGTYREEQHVGTSIRTRTFCSVSLFLLVLFLVV
jgi:hypothetical protein